MFQLKLPLGYIKKSNPNDFLGYIIYKNYIYQQIPNK